MASLVRGIAVGSAPQPSPLLKRPQNETDVQRMTEIVGQRIYRRRKVPVGLS